MADEQTLKTSRGLPKKFAVGLLIILAILGLSFVFLRPETQRSEAKGIFSIGDRVYSKDEVDKIINYPTSKGQLSKDEASKQAYESLKKIAVAEQLGVKFDDTIVKQYASTLNSGQDETSTQWFALKAKEQIIENTISNSYPASYEGYSFLFWYGQHLASGPAYTPPRLNDPKLVSEDKSYAEAKAKEYHSKLQDGTISPEDALKQIKADKKLDVSGFYSTKFITDKASSWFDKIAFLPIRDSIANAKKVGLTDINEGKNIVSNQTDVTKSKNMYFYFNLIDKADSSAKVSKSDYEALLKSIKSNYVGYKD